MFAALPIQKPDTMPLVWLMGHDTDRATGRGTISKVFVLRANCKTDRNINTFVNLFTK